MDRGEARAALGIPTDARVAVWHGRVSIWQKGLDILLEVWKHICRQGIERNLRLLIVGTGKDSEQFHRRITEMQVSDVLWLDEFMNDRNAIGRCLSAADVYVFPSRHEGFPVSVIEAMACGLPVVATEVQGIPDILMGGELSGGLVVPQEDSEALAHALGRILEDEAWSRELGHRARHRAETHFSHKTVGQQLRDFLTQH